jgi:uridine kinase
MSPVVAVSAPPGGGKTSLVRALATRLGDAATIHFDDYEELTRRPPEEMLDWLRQGGDWNALDLSRLAGDLAHLRAEAPERYVLFDTLLGRQHAALARSIDLVIWIDIPLDLALARKIREFASWGEDAGEFRAWLTPYLEHYLAGIRDLIALQATATAASADLVLDGRAPLAELAALAAAEITRRLP